MNKPRRNIKRRSTSDAVEILDRLFVGSSASRRAGVERAYEDALVGHLIYNARIKAGLTQKQLADLIETDQSVISRLEDADYRGHSLGMLRRLAAAMGKRLDIRFVDVA